MGNTDHHFNYEKMTDKSTNRPSLLETLLQPKHAQYIGAWNVRTMYEAGRAAQIEREMKK